jgi:hypothetical protein
MFNVPLPDFPMNRSSLFVQLDPLPVTFTTPVAVLP